MTVSDGIMILAVLLAPLLAVQVQKVLEHYREDRERKVRVFKVLMATRATGLSADHVQALNLIDLEFQGKRHRKTREAWKEYLDHLGAFPQDNKELLPVWADKKADLLATLLKEMGGPIGYEFDVVHIKKGIYLPLGHTQLETEQALLRKRALEVLFGDATIKMDVNSIPVDEDALSTQKELSGLLLETLKNAGGLPVTLLESKKHDA